MEDKPLWIPALVWQRWSITLYHSISLGSTWPAEKDASSQMASDAGSIIGLTIIHMIVFVNNNNNNNYHKESSHLTYEGTRMKQKEFEC